MGRYTGPSCRLCRRAGEKLFLKGDRCFSPRCAVERRHNPPGAIATRRRRVSEYGTHLREKQKAQQTYGLMESQFRGYMTKAFENKGITGLHLLRTLERRLDNVVYNLGFADSRKEARQLVNHGHIRVRGVKTDIPSYQVQVGDVISWKEADKLKTFFKEQVVGIPRRPMPPWLSLDVAQMTGQVTALPADEDLPKGINSRLITEYYSR
ncbi:MAG: 30S ribosomal protein S4 [Dehalococcoidia bacterium]|nr:30S ribosomal protein S4 [Dehalococcoidia bacterium]MSQ17615.1 30S ribosomal protein S4 [Dehalococcoidia bacterium]